MVKQKQYYVYLHLRPDLPGVNKCFYVGKGTHKRSRDLSTRNPYHKNIVNKFGSQNIIVKRLPCYSEVHALRLEAEMIAILRRMGIKLTNVTDGGESPTGYVPTPEARARGSIITRSLWKTEKYRSKVIAGMNLANLDPELKQQRIEACREMTTNPVYKAKQVAALKLYWSTNTARKSDLSVIARLRFEDPALRAAYSEATKAQWANPEYRKNNLEAKRLYFSKPENRAKASESAKLRFSNPEELEKITKINRERGRDPAHRAKLSAIACARPPVSVETKLKMSKAAKIVQADRIASGYKAKPVTEETRKLLSDKSKLSWVDRKERGESVSESTRAKMSEAAKNRVRRAVSEETKEKIRTTKAANKAKKLAPQP